MHSISLHISKEVVSVHALTTDAVLRWELPFKWGTGPTHYQGGKRKFKKEVKIKCDPIVYASECAW